MKLKLGEAYLNNIYDSVEAYTSAPPADTEWANSNVKPRRTFCYAELHKKDTIFFIW